MKGLAWVCALFNSEIPKGPRTHVLCTTRVCWRTLAQTDELVEHPTHHLMVMGWVGVGGGVEMGACGGSSLPQNTANTFDNHGSESSETTCSMLSALMEYPSEHYILRSKQTTDKQTTLHSQTKARCYVNATVEHSFNRFSFVWYIAISIRLGCGI